MAARLAHTLSGGGGGGGSESTASNLRTLHPTIGRHPSIHASASSLSEQHQTHSFGVKITTIAVVSASSDVNIHHFCRMLHDQLCRHGSTRTIDKTTIYRY